MQTRSDRAGKNLAALLVTLFIDFLGFGIILPIIAPVMLNPSEGVLPPDVSYGARAILLGFVIAAFPVAQFFGAPILGALSDKYGRKIILLTSISGTALSLGLFGTGVVMRSLPLIFFSRVLNGFTGGNVSTAQSAIADLSDMSSKARNFGLIGMTFGLGFVLGPFIGGILADPSLGGWFTFATPFWFASILSVCNVILVSVWFEETLETRGHHITISLTTGFRNLRRGILNRRLRVMLAVVFCTMFGFSFFTQFFQVYLITKFQYDQAAIGLLYAYIGLWIAFTQGGLVRVLSRWLPSGPALRVSLILLSIGLILLLIPQDHKWLYLVLPIVAMSQGIAMPNATAIISNTAASTGQGEVLGINQSVQAVAFAVPPIVAGFATSIDAGLPIMLAAAFTFLAWIITMMLFRIPETMPGDAAGMT